MATRSQKVKLGIFLAAAGGLFAATVLVFAGLAFLSDEETYYVRFSESVSGLEVGAPVKLRGVRVGSVTQIELDPDDVELVRVTLKVDASTPIQEDAAALMMMQGITGLRFVEIRDGTGDAPRLPPESFIPEGQSVFARLSGSAEDLALKADLVLDNLLQVTGPGGRARIDNMLARGEVMANNLDALVVELTKVATQTHALIEENRIHLRSTLANIDRTTNEIAQVASLAGGAVSEVDTAELQAAIGNMSSTLGTFQVLLTRLIQLLDHSQSEIRATIYNLRLAAEGFKQLADGLQRQPSRLFFGGSPRERDLP
jgi:phospholipid/cholesterol/gamma-HCH transport system substrate-binding protein